MSVLALLNKLKMFGLYETLICVIICAFATWLMQTYWSQRRFYALAAKIPGRRGYSLPIIGHAHLLFGKPSDVFKKLMKLIDNQYETYKIWIGYQLFVVVIDPDDLEIVLNSKHALEKDSLYKLSSSIFGQGLLAAPVSMWKDHRRLLNPTFSQTILDTYIDVYIKHSLTFIEKMKKHVGKTNFDIYRSVLRCQLDVICSTVMGVELNAQDDDSSYFEHYHKVHGILMQRMVQVLYHNDFIFNLSSMGKEMKHRLKCFNEVTSKIIKDKRTELMEKSRSDQHCENVHAAEDLTKLKRNCFLTRLLELSDAGHFTDQQVHDEVNTFIAAGPHAPALSICFTILMLAMHQEVQIKVHEEMIDIFGDSDRPVDVSDISKMTYLDRVIKETMRLFPISVLIARSTTADIQLTSCTIPAGCSVTISLVPIHRNPNYWPDPMRFDPDRFLPEETAKRNPYCYLPFSRGPRNCIGLRAATMTMKVQLSDVIRRYAFTTDYKSVEDIQLKDEPMQVPLNGFRVTVQSRK